MMKMKKIMIFSFVNIALLISFFFINNSDIFLLLTTILWLNLILYCIFDINNNSTIFTFAIAFFVFLMGRQILETFFNYSPSIKFSDEINYKTEVSLFISILFVIVGYILGRTNKIKFNFLNREIVDYNSSNNANVRRTSLIVFYITYILLIISIFDIVLFVREHGYLEYYTSFSSRIPYIFRKLGDMAPVAFYVFLATMPNKKACQLPIALYIIYLLLTLGTGKRFTFVAGLLILFVYFVFRNRINNEGKPWFGKREGFISIIAFPIMIIFLGVVNNLRFGKDTNGGGLFERVLDFFYNQGVSINVIKYTFLYSDDLPNKIYSFGSLIRILKANVISKFIGIQTYSGNTIENALNGNSYEYTISYFALKKSYLAGNGLGSSYIAEVYHDFGFFGLVIANVIIGFVIAKLFYITRFGIWITAISFNVLKSILFAPRGSADAFIAEFLDFTTLGTLTIIYVLSKFNKNNSLKRRFFKRKV